MSGAAQDTMIASSSRPKRQAEDEVEVLRDNDEDYLGDDDDVDAEVMNLSCLSVNNKYKYAAKVVKGALKTILTKCIPGAKITDLCSEGDIIINDKVRGYPGHEMMLRGVAFPTCISANGRVCNVSPCLNDDGVLADGDIIKINMACHVDGYIATLAYTHAIGNPGISKEVSEFIAASALPTGKDLLQYIVPGEKLSKVHEVIKVSIEACGFWTAKVRCYKLEQFSSEIDQVDPKPMNDEDLFEENEVYVIDVITCNQNVELKKMPETKATIYSIFSDVGLEGDARKIYSLIRKNFALRPFTTRELEKDDLSFVMNNRDILQAYPILFVEDEVVAAHFKSTIFVKGRATNETTHDHTFKAKGKGNRGCDKLSYCGMVPVGEEGSGGNYIISSISWNNEAKNPCFACTGSFGTLVCTYEPRDVLGPRDLGTGWVKVIISSSPAKICRWAPLGNGKFLAVGATATSGPLEYDVVYLFDYSSPGKNQHAYTFHVGFGINTFSWNRTGIHLLVASNDMNHVVIITRKRSSINNHAETIHFPHMKHPQPNKANFVGLFHPVKDDFFVGSSSGFLLMYSFKDVPDGETPWERVGSMLTEVGVNGITIDGFGDMLICTMLDMSLKVISIDYGAVVRRSSRVLQVVHSLEPAPEVAIKFSRLWGGYLATIDKKKLITIYRLQDGLEKICDNKEEMDPTKLFKQLAPMDWGNDGLLATAGEDGIIHVWSLCHSRNPSPSYTIKKWNPFMEKNFYLKKQLQFGASKDVRNKFSVFHKHLSELAEGYSTKIQDLEERLQRVMKLSFDGLEKLYRGDTLSQGEQIKILEDIVSASSTI